MMHPGYLSGLSAAYVATVTSSASRDAVTTASTAKLKYSQKAGGVVV